MHYIVARMRLYFDLMCATMGYGMAHLTDGWCWKIRNDTTRRFCFVCRQCSCNVRLLFLVYSAWIGMLVSYVSEISRIGKKSAPKVS